jgi:hypothetical protein
MPLFGLDPLITDLQTQILDILQSGHNIFNYSPVSIIEIKWQVIKLIKEGYDGESLEKQFSQALVSLKEDDRYNLIGFLEARINDLSFELRKLGHTDYFDTVIASSALWESQKFLTEDEPLKLVIQEYFKRNSDTPLKIVEILSWEEFIKSM